MSYGQYIFQSMDQTWDKLSLLHSAWLPSNPFVFDNLKKRKLNNSHCGDAGQKNMMINFQL